MLPEQSLSNSEEFIEEELSQEEKHVLQLLEDTENKIIWINCTQKGIIPGTLDSLKNYYTEIESFHILESLARKGIIDRIDNGILLLCPKCGNHTSSFLKSCPSCRSIKLQMKNKIVHVPCGHLGTFEEFKGGTTITCPVCQEEVESDKILDKNSGFSYSDPYFECQECRFSSNRAQILSLCTSCNTKYTDANAVKLEQTGFKIAVEPVKRQKQSKTNPPSKIDPNLEEIKEPKEKAKSKKKKTLKISQSELEEPEKQREKEDKINQNKNEISDETPKEIEANIEPPQTEFKPSILDPEMIPENVLEFIEDIRKPEIKEINSELIKKDETVSESRSKKLPLKKSLVNNKAQILIVEDDVFSNESLKFLLESILEHNCEVRCLYDGEKVTEEIESKHYDLVLLDNKLPNKNGLEILKELKSKDNKTNIIFITGYSDEETAVQAMKLGAKDYLSKGSFSVDNLIEAINEIIKDD